MEYTTLTIDLAGLPNSWPKSRKAYCVKNNLEGTSAQSMGSGNKAKRRSGKTVNSKGYGLPCPSVHSFPRFDYSNGISY